MSSFDQATSILRQLEAFVGQGAGKDLNTTRREAVRLSRLLTASLEKPEDLAFETGLFVRIASKSPENLKDALRDPAAANDCDFYLAFLRPVLQNCCQAQYILYFNGKKWLDDDIRAYQHHQSRRSSSKCVISIKIWSISDANPLVRTMRMLAALGLVLEVGKGEYKALPVTHVMAVPPMMAAQRHFWDQSVPSMAKFPEWLDKNGLKCPSDPRNGLFQYAFNTELETFEYWHSNPEVLDNVNTMMEGVRSTRPAWVDWFPVKDRVFDGVEIESNKAVLVDVGGGRGHDLEAFRAKFPQEKGKLILEDLPSVIDDVKSIHEDVALQKHDFFQPQPIQGARAYYFSHIFHDWSDEPSINILKQTASAMTKGYSKLFINDIILPDTNCSLFQAGFDINMMVMHAGIERSRDQWTSLLDRAGFKVLDFWLPPGDGEGIVEAVLK